MVTHFDFGYDDAINRVKEELGNMKTSDSVDAIHREAFDMAIKALEQKPCEDLISRQAVNNLLSIRPDGIIKNLPPVTSLQYLGSCDSLEDLKLYSAGDVIYNNSDGLTYVCVGADSWEPLSYTADLYQPKVPKIQRKVKSHCPHCGGPITCISSDAEYKGYQKCEWCMSVINIYEDEDSGVNQKLRILNAD